MRRSCEVIVLAALVSCGPPAEAPPCDPEITWDSWGEGFFRTWCTSCHASTVEGADRYGAPRGVDFDAWEGVAQQVAGIREVALGSAPTMPPVGSVPRAELAVLEEYLSCGIAVPPAPTDGCPGDRLEPGPVTVASPQDAAALCARADTVDGDLEILGDADLGCLCGVGGSLTVGGTATSVLLGSVAWIGGDVRVEGALVTLDLPEVDSIGGSLVATGAVLETIRLREVQSIAGSLTVSAAPRLAEIELFALASVGGEVVLEDLAQVVRLDGLPALSTVGGGVRLADLDALVEIDGFEAVTDIRGGLTLASLENVARIEGFVSLRATGGSLTIEGLPRLERVEGFQELATVGADLRLADLPALEFVPPFAALETVTGVYEVERTGALLMAGGPSLEALGGLRVADGAALAAIDGYGRIERISGPIEVAGCPLLAEVTAFEALEAVDGDVSFRDVAVDLRLPGLAALRGLGGSLVVVANPGMTVLSDLAPDLVAGDLTITGNPALPSGEAWALHDRIGADDVGGTVTISDNGL